MPNTTYSSSIAFTEITGIAARRVGACAGIMFLIIALLPKAMGLLLAIPDPVIAAYLFVLGMQIVIQDGIDYRKTIVVGVSFWAGAGFQNNLIFADYLSDWVMGLLGNGMTAGGLTAILLILSRLDDNGEAHKKRRLLLVAWEDNGVAELEFIAAADTGNIEDRMALLGRQASEDVVEHEISLRLLRHFASSVRHQQYSDADIVTVRVNA